MKLEVILFWCLAQVGVAQTTGNTHQGDEYTADDEEAYSDYDDDYYRTSDLPNEQSVAYKPDDIISAPAPPKSQRIGCICMDGRLSYKANGGSCSGHGGVRFWLYLDDNADTLRHPTRRHLRHTQRLSPQELAELAYHPKSDKSSGKEGNFSMPMRASYARTDTTIIVNHNVINNLNQDNAPASTLPSNVINTGSGQGGDGSFWHYFFQYLGIVSVAIISGLVFKQTRRN